MIARLAGTVVLVATLVGCSSDPREDTFVQSKQALGVLTQLISSRRSGPPPKVELTASQVAAFDQPVLQVNPETFGGSDFLGRVTSRRDSRLGMVEVWQSSDNAQLFLRNGVVVGTRGIGGDIISANANTTIRALSGASNGSGSRTYIISDGDVTTTQYEFRCTIDNLGAENVTVVNQSFRTNHLRETCMGGPNGTAVLRNDYWVQKPSNLVRKSRQWIGPRVGYFEITVVKN